MKPMTFVLALLAVPLTATGEEPDLKAAKRRESFKNPLEKGTEELACDIWYPSAADGSETLAQGPTAGRSVIVFLHGRGGFSFVYRDLGQRLAQRGFIVVLSDTARTDPDEQIADGKALFAALAGETKRAGSFWQSAFDMTRVGLAGHSMGGGATAHILAANPGYKAGFAFAPWAGTIPFARDAERIAVPLGIVHGKGDKTLPWAATGKRLYDAAPSSIPKFLYLLDADCNHMNVAIRGVLAGAQQTPNITTRILDLCAAFFDQHLRGATERLTALLKKPDPNLAELYLNPGATPSGPKPEALRRRLY